MLPPEVLGEITPCLFQLLVAPGMLSWWLQPWILCLISHPASSSSADGFPISSLLRVASSVVNTTLHRDLRGLGIHSGQ